MRGDLSVGLLDQRYAVQLPAYVGPIDPRGASQVGAFSANQARGCRVAIPRSGTLTDLAVFIGVASGNIDVGVYSTAATRAKLYSTGSISCPTAGQWNIVGALSLAVSEGDQYDFAVAIDNGTATVGECQNLGAAGMSVLPAGFIISNGAAPKMNWFVAAAFPLPATIAEGSLLASGVIPFIIARIA